MSSTGIPDVPHFLAHAHAMEVEAAERYRLFATQMEVHNNPVVAGLFTTLAEVEEKHAAEILARAGPEGLPDVAPWDFAWSDPEAPETAPVETAHYLMTAHHVLSAALAGERRACAFYERVAREAGDAEVRRLAESFVEEERAHVAMVREMLDRHPAPEPGWDEDMDPPVEL